MAEKINHDKLTPADDDQAKEGPMSTFDSRPVVYAEVGANYRAIDDLRLRLMGALPLATGTGIFLLLKPDGSGDTALLLAVGIFGIVATISLFFYEVHGVEKCAHFIHRGQQLEESFDVRGSFTLRPHQVFGVISELLPAALIYPASLAGWLYVALAGLPDPFLGVSRPLLVAGVVAAAFLAAIAAATVIILIRERKRVLEWRDEDLLFDQKRATS